MMINEEYQQMEQEHLTLLTSFGLHYTSILLTTAKLLQPHYEKETASEEREELLNILLETARKHLELIEWSVKERQKSISSDEGNIEL